MGVHRMLASTGAYGSMGPGALASGFLLGVERQHRIDPGPELDGRSSGVDVA